MVVVPDMAKVRITNLSEVTEMDEHQESAHYADRDLRTDLITVAHDSVGHASKGDTARNLKELAWFPGMIKRVEYHCDTCPHCINRRATFEHVGASVMAANRFRVVQVDHCIFDKALAMATTLAGVLTVVDAATKETRFIAVKDLTGRTAASALLQHWYPTRGTPKVCRSDKGSAFISDIFIIFREMLGIRIWDFSCEGNPTHHSLVENKHKTLRDIMSEGVNNGDINSEDDARIYIAMAEARINLHNRKSGAVPFELVTGQPPRTVLDAIKNKPNAIEPSKKDMDPIESHFVDVLAGRISDDIKWAFAKRDEEARSNAMIRDVKAFKSASTLHELKVGSKVSYEDGKVGKILRYTKTTSTGPVKVLLKTNLDNPLANETKEVMYSKIRPLADPRPSRRVSGKYYDKMEINPGQFIFANAPAGLINGGIVTHVDGDEIQYQDCRQADKTCDSPRRFSGVWSKSYFDFDAFFSLAAAVARFGIPIARFRSPTLIRHAYTT